MEWHRRASPVRVPVLAMRSALPDFLKAEMYQESGHFTRLQDGQ